MASIASSILSSLTQSFRRTRAAVVPPQCTLEELCELMTYRGSDGVEKLANYGGISGLCEQLRTCAENGLTGGKEELEMRKQRYGENVIPPPRSKTYWQLAWDAFTDATLLILTVSAIVSIALSFYKPEALPSEVYELGFALQIGDPYGWVEGAAILAAVITIVNVAAWNDWQKERQFRSLQEKVRSDTQYMVVRRGRCMQLRKAEIVVGDVVPLKYGDMLAVDGVLIHGNDLKIDESSLTGEAELVHKSADRDIVLLSGTRVMEGNGRMLVVAVGPYSQAGKIFALMSASHDSKSNEKPKPQPKARADSKATYGSLSKNVTADRTSASSSHDEDEDTNESKQASENLLQMKLEFISSALAFGGMGIAALTFLVQSLRFAIQFFAIYHFEWSYAYISVFIDYLINGIIILVIAVPEGLPIAVTIALAYSIRRMLDDSNLVRHLYACSTMGNATTICTDKTGTLTTNRMTVVSTYAGGQFLKDRPVTYDEIPIPMRDIFITGMCVNSSYTSSVQVSPVPGELPIQVGNKTECALLGYVQSMGENYQIIRQLFPESELHKVYTFNSARKCMSTVVRKPDRNGFILYMKGAPEKVLERCTTIFNEAGDKVKLTEAAIKTITTDVIDSMAKNSLRTIALAVKEFSDEPDWQDENEVFSEMTCVGICGIEDPIRPEVPRAIASCQRAGVTVCMVTGDNINTAISIARKCGILPRRGDDMMALDTVSFNRQIRDQNGHVSQLKFDSIWPKLRVLARATPEDKYILVKHVIRSKIREKGEVVAVTGDGTNDGPALRKADVGFAMGIAGTDVAKEASDIILTDDNFNSIVQAIKWGRNVYDSITKFVQFQLTVNVVAVSMASIGSVILSSSPLQALQMLWINLIMDTLAALCLATEKPNDELLKRKPYGRNEPIVNKLMLFNILSTSVFQIAVAFVIIFAGPQLFDFDSNVVYARGAPGVYTYEPTQHFTFMFNVFVMMTLFNEINCRKAHAERNVFSHLFGNYLFIVIWIVCLIIQACIVQFGGIVFVCAPLSVELWMWSLLFGFSSLLWYQLMITVQAIFFRLKSRKKRSPSSKVTTTEERTPLVA